ncbi:LPS translocon maturation chaperone LptM [Derxia gummosa]|uniref:LPS translocon maturation chaperone LptM n=1 Tax=Derxia gummosa DSM 723 TaxID=1121388 RepID=A0AC36KJ77_9BURK
MRSQGSAARAGGICRAVLGATILASALAGCGLKGPLTLPTEPRPPAVPRPAAPMPASTVGTPNTAPGPTPDSQSALPSSPTPAPDAARPDSKRP